jgi:vacuolar-type H+-ATPase subunit I/STV1
LLNQGRNLSLNIIDQMNLKIEQKNIISSQLEQALDDGNYLEIKKSSLLEQKNATKEIRSLKKDINKNKKDIQQQISKLKKSYKEEIKIVGVQLRQETKLFYLETMKPLLNNYKLSTNSESTSLKQIMLNELPIIQEKDIEFNEKYDKNNAEYQSFAASSYYSPLQQFRLEDKIMINSEEIVIIRNFADVLVGEKFGIQNIKILKESIDSDIEVISEGN